MNNIKDKDLRFWKAHVSLNTKTYSYSTSPHKCANIKLNPPKDRQYVLRLLIKTPQSQFEIPKQYQWTKPIIDASIRDQNEIKIKHPFTYLTIRHGYVTSSKDDVWHVDGFSMKNNHLPEQNYVWANVNPTEYLNQTFYIPEDFDPLKHNIHSFFQKHADESNIKTMLKETMYCCDPYVIHRRPTITTGTNRTFVRVSHVQQEINDKNNTINPLLPTTYTRCGITEFRAQLQDFV